MQKQALGMFGQVGAVVGQAANVGKAVAKGVMKNVFGLEFHVDDSSMNMLLDEISRGHTQSLTCARPHQIV
jgi:hypothetical protein